VDVETLSQPHARDRRSEQLGDFDTGLSGLDDTRFLIRA
jgi:hypothetical protein